MANLVWHVTLGIQLNLERADLGPHGIPNLWDTLYQQDREYGHRKVPVEERGLQCAGICRDEGVVAWMYLRKGPGGQRIAVHQHKEDEARHAKVNESDEHKAYKERIVRVATQAGHTAAPEVRAPGMRTDALVEGADGLRIGWEVQLSTAGREGPSSVRARARRAVQHGITPVWHTDRRNYADRNDAHWTRSDSLPPEVIAKNRDLRVVSGYRVLEFFRCDASAVLRCPDEAGYRRCGRMHAVPKPRDIMFDDLVRGTAAGEVAPLDYRVRSRTYRFWVPATHRDRYLDVSGSPADNPSEPEPVGFASTDGPTCRPGTSHRATPVRIATRTVNWNSSQHWSSERLPCRYCGTAVNLRDDQGRPSCKVCHEQRLT